MSDWDDVYLRKGREWGVGPGALVDVVAELVATIPRSKAPRVLDVGCGYGRDSAYLASATGGRVLGVDPSAEAIRLARQDHPAVDFQIADMAGAVALGPFDIVHAANVYHLLRPAERTGFLADVRSALVGGGHLVLNALSVTDPEEYGSGEPVAGEPGSFVRNGRYGHFFTAEEVELEMTEAGLRPERLEEVDYEEPHAEAAAHHHRGWVVVAARPIGE